MVTFRSKAHEKQNTSKMHQIQRTVENHVSSELAPGLRRFRNDGGNFIPQDSVGRGPQRPGDQLQALHVRQRLTVLPVAHRLARDKRGGSQLALRHTRSLAACTNPNANPLCNVHERLPVLGTGNVRTIIPHARAESRITYIKGVLHPVSHLTDLHITLLDASL